MVSPSQKRQVDEQDGSPYVTKPGRRRGRFIALIGIAGVVLIGGAIFAVSVWLTPPATDADRVADTMRSATADVAGAVPVQYVDEFGDELSKAFPKGTTVNPLAGTWEPDGIAGGTMDVELTTDGKTTTLRAIFGHTDDSWRLVTMEGIE
jgi:hypothetical protein